MPLQIIGQSPSKARVRACVRARGSADSYALRVYSCTPEKASLFGLVYTSLLRLSFPLLSVLAVSRGCTEGAEAWKCPLLEGRRVNDEDSNRMERIVGRGRGRGIYGTGYLL